MINMKAPGLLHHSSLYDRLQSQGQADVAWDQVEEDDGW